MNKFKLLVDKHSNVIYISLLLLNSAIYFIIMKRNIDGLNSAIDNIDVLSKGILSTSIIYIITTILLSIMYYLYIQNSVNKFCDKISKAIDGIMIKKEHIEFDIYEETITSKVENKLKHLFEIIKNDRKMYLNEKSSIKTLIGDISHQIKTPIANISMYNETLIDRELNEDQKNTCLRNMKFQVDKLEWLVNCLIKMSRLESGVINLKKVETNISSIVANALGGVYIKAEAKGIDIEVNCDNNINVLCDRKWTSEAIFNILENAVKYSNENTKIRVEVENLEIFTKLDIIDEGIGINEADINNIFKRFYRGSEVSHQEGVGIGLYLSREIISKQGGYIKVKSDKGMGSKFSIYLLNN